MSLDAPAVSMLMCIGIGSGVVAVLFVRLLKAAMQVPPPAQSMTWLLGVCRVPAVLMEPAIRPILSVNYARRIDRSLASVGGRWPPYYGIAVSAVNMFGTRLF